MKICQAKKCDSQIAEKYTFCKYHWSLLPSEAQDELAEAYGTGHWHRTLGKIRVIIYDEEQRL